MVSREYFRDTDGPQTAERSAGRRVSVRIRKGRQAGADSYAGGLFWPGTLGWSTEIEGDAGSQVLPAGGCHADCGLPAASD